VNKEGTGRARLRGGSTRAGGRRHAQVIGMKQGEKYDEAKVAERFRDHSLSRLRAARKPEDRPRRDRRERRLFGARAAAPISRTVLDYFLLGKVPAGLTMPTPKTKARGEESD